ncbi:spermidine synthase [Psychromicrobium xiongbiense]|uniref:spermidine synthase n=1 Tax=Psychromicrobium xiongbiense TaxID=3051184 RepID=UPI0025531D4B|nr:fused MFS/spermidine synthase [Psychromicrobium sp. YIM S02556]
MTAASRLDGIQRSLSVSGVQARIVQDPFSSRQPGQQGAYLLEIGGAEQSHVDLDHPERIFYEYLNRIGTLLDAIRPAGEAVSVLHLGAGALTLARYCAVTRPGSVQVAVELERELLDLVLTQLPLPAGATVHPLIGDVRESLPEAAAWEPYELIVLDIFSGPEAPAHVACPEFYAEAATLLAPGGVLAVNIGDDPPLTLVRSQTRALSSILPAAALTGPTAMFSARYPGNLVLAAVALESAAVGSRAPVPGTSSETERWPQEWTEAWLQRGPHPCTVLSGVELEDFARA